MSMPGPVIVAVLREALVKFGRIDWHNREQVTRWVMRRCRELEQPEPVDAKAKAAGQ